MILYQSQNQAENSTCLSAQAHVDYLIADLFLCSSNSQILVMVGGFFFFFLFLYWASQQPTHCDPEGRTTDLRLFRWYIHPLQRGEEVKKQKSLHSLSCSWKGRVAPTFPWQLVHIRGWGNWLCPQKPCGNPLQAFKVQLKCQLQPMMLSDLSSFSGFRWQLQFVP